MEEKKGQEKTMPSIEVKELQFAYGKHSVLRELSFTAEKGQCIGIVGKNGCGKSTLLNILAGMRKPKAGQILYEGKNVCTERKLFRQMIGFVPQENILFEELTVRDNLKLWYPDKRTLTEELRSGILAELGLSPLASKTVKKLSGGQKKRVNIGCALAGHPKILILDEPGAALDLAAKEEIAAYLTAYKQQGGTVLITTHEEQELKLCDRLLILKDGRLKEVNPALRGVPLISQF